MSFGIELRSEESLIIIQENLVLMNESTNKI